MLVTNRKNRCSLCGGRELLQIDEDLEEVVYSSLKEGKCKNEEECSQNRESQETEILLEVEDDELRWAAMNVPSMGVEVRKC